MTRPVVVYMLTAAVSTVCAAEDVPEVHRALLAVGGAHDYSVAKEDLPDWTSKRRQQYVDELRRLRRRGLAVTVVDNRKRRTE